MTRQLHGFINSVYYAVQLSSSINSSSINRCAENTDGRNFLHLNTPSVIIDCVHLHTAHTFDDKGLKNIDSVTRQVSDHSPLHPLTPQTLQSPPVTISITDFFISTNAAGMLAPYPSPDWKSANLLQLRCGEQDLNLYDLVGPHEQSRC